jgi:hypothetical protein
MKKLKELREIIAKLQLEAASMVRSAQQTGNPHLSTRATGENRAYILVLQEIDKLLIKKEKLK